MFPLLALFLAGSSLGLSSPTQVGLEASFAPALRGSSSAAILVHFMSLAEGVRVNQEPAPRLRLETPGILLDRQPPARRAVQVDPDFARYVEAAEPVRFPVAIDPSARRGRHVVRAMVSYSYCSKTQGWCRKGSEPIEVVVEVR